MGRKKRGQIQARVPALPQGYEPRDMGDDGVEPVPAGRDEYFGPRRGTLAAVQRMRGPNTPHEGDDPDPTVPVHVVRSTAPALALRPATVEDVDRLWDWIRQDGDLGKAFLGIECRTSLTLHETMQQFVLAQQQGTALLFALEDGGHHQGFVIVNPLDLSDQVGRLHLYLAPAVRGTLAALLPKLLAVADREYPDLSLIIAVEDEAAARLYRPFGFTTQYVLTRRARGRQE